MSKKGISSVSLAITVVVLLILVTSISVSLTYSINNAKKMVFAKEIYNIQSIVTEYIEKENVLPAKEAVQVKISDTILVDDEEIKNSEGEVLLNVLDLAELGIKNTTYGNGVLGESDLEKAEDVYAVSQVTGRVYYIAGFEMNNKKYYTLTDELLNMIDKKQVLNIGESTILFIPDILGWTNQGVTVKVRVPDEYTIDSVTTDNTNIERIEETIDGVKYWSINKAKVAQSYTVTVKYTKNDTSQTISYTTKFDNVAPTISKDTSIANTAKSIRGLNAKDDESGIKHFKYVEGVVENDYNAATYMNEFGKKIKSGSLKAKQRAIYTLYAEDKAGNYRLIHVDSEGERAYFTIENDTGTNEFILNNAYELSLLNYRIYGNSIQNGTPSVDAPVEIESVGDKTVNLLPYPYKTTDRTSNGITYKVNEDGSILLDGTATSATTFYLYQDLTSLIPGLEVGDQITISKTVSDESQANNVYFICNYYDETSTMQQGAIATTVLTGKTTITDEWKGVGAYIHIPNGNTVDNLIIKPMIQKGTIATEYEPYDKYKIPVTVRGKNIINFKSFKPYSTGKITLLDDGLQYTGNYYVSIDAPFLKNGIKYYMSWEYESDSNITPVVRLHYTDETYSNIIYNKSSFTVPEDKQVKRILLYAEITATVYTTIFKNIQLEENEITSYEPYVETTTTNIYLDEPLRKIGDYADYIDFKSGMLVRKIKHREFTENDNWSVYTSVSNHFQVPVGDNYFSNTENYTMSNYYLANKLNNNYYYSGDYSVISVDGSRIRFKNKDYTTLDEWKDWLRGLNENLKVDYVLKTPLETSIELPEIITTSGYNRMTIDTKVSPSETNIRYYNRVQ